MIFKKNVVSILNMERNILAEARRRKIRLTVDKFNESNQKSLPNPVHIF